MAKISFILLAVSFVLGNYFRFSLLSPDIHFTALDVTVFVIIVLFFLKSPRQFFSSIISFPTTKPALIFSIAALFSLLLSLPRYGLLPGLVGLSYLVRWLLLAVILPPILPKSLSPVILGFLLVLIGTIQYIYFPDIRPLSVLGWDEHYFRLVGTILDPGFLGLLLVLLLVYISFRRWKYPYLGVAAWTWTYIALALTYSRSSFLSFIAAMSFFAYHKKNWRIAAGSILLIIATLFILPRTPDGEGVKLERTNSILSRIENWQHSVQIFSRFPLFGAGFNMYRYAQSDFGFISQRDWQTTHAGAGADSSLLFVLATTGICGFSLYLYYLIHLYSSSPPIVKTCLAALFVHSWFLNSLFYPFILVYLALLLSISHSNGYKSP